MEARPIKTGADSEGVVVVTDGLQLGERVVTSNQYRLQPGRPRAAAGAPEVGGEYRRAADRAQRAMSISEPFVRRPIATSLLMGGILLIGIVAWPLLPVAPLPQVDFPTIVVTTNLPGASPETMATSVATPLEYQFAEIPGLSQMTSTSVLGNCDRSRCSSTWIATSTPPRRTCSRPSTPPAASCRRTCRSRRSTSKINPADSPILILAVHSDVLPLTDSRRLRRERDRAAAVADRRASAQVVIGGQQKPAVRVQVDPAKIASLGIQLEDVANVITAATVDAPKGSINGTLHNFAIYDNDQLEKAAPWNDIVVAYKNGAPVRIRDIGIAVDAAENNQLTRLAERQARHPAADLQAAGRQRHRHAAARPSSSCPRRMLSVPPSIKVDQRRRSHHHHQGLGARRGVHAAADHRPGGAW